MKRYLVGLAAAAALLTLTVGLACAQNKKGNPVVVLETSKGIIEVELNEAKAPISSKNFLDYVDSHFFDGLIFHRVIDNFMIQGGGFTEKMAQKPVQAPIKNESTNGLKNDNYTVAMARTNNPDSATSQFFINVKDNDFLNYVDDMRPGYAVFGRVTEGMETVNKIKAVPTATMGPHQNVPTTPVVIEKAECMGGSAAAPATPPAKK